MSFADKIKQQEEVAKEEGISQQGGGWFKAAEGDNRFRVLAEPEMIFEKYKVGICYTDCGYQGTAKFLTFILDRKDNQIKLAKLPYTVGTAIAGYETDEEYQFQGYPMPYDLNLKAKGAGTKEVEYTLIAGRALTPVASNILEDLKKKGSLLDIIRKMKDNKKEEHMADGTWQKNQDLKKESAASVASTRVAGGGKVDPGYDYPEEDLNPADIPF